MGNNTDQFPLGLHNPQQQLPTTYASDAAAEFHQSPTVAAAVVEGGESAAAEAFPQGGPGLEPSVGSSSEPLKRKRGRPRKYKAPTAAAPAAATPAAKRGRGRPRGSCNKNHSKRKTTGSITLKQPPRGTITTTLSEASGDDFGSPLDQSAGSGSGNNNTPPGCFSGIP